ncbi:MAG: TetR/AcrR family transcriptional regulator [Chloroflexota bacterium]
MDRLTKEEWLDHGLKTLATDGFTALKADKLVKTLGVSRGSFYWHFKNLADFHAAVLRRWQEVSVIKVIEELESSHAGPTEKLAQLIGVASQDDLGLSQAIRAWAFNDAKVKQLVNAVDMECIGYLAQLLKEMALKDEKALVRAKVLYCGYLGQIMLGQSVDDEVQEILIAELIQIATQEPV